MLATTVIFMSIAMHAEKLEPRGGAIDPNDTLLLEKGSNQSAKYFMAVVCHMLSFQMTRNDRFGRNIEPASQGGSNN